MNFSVLMSIYYKEKSEYFDRAMKSIWNEQTTKPDEIVLVQDGKFTNELYEVIEKWQERLRDKFKIISLEQNLGLGDALNIGLQYCSYELVARMDTDDIAMSDRFEKQLKVFENSDTDICSSWVSEFDKDENKIISYRKLPEYHQDIFKFAKKRNPLNHPAVMFKKLAVESVGGYKRMMWFEDYYLWVRMLLNNAKFYNIQEPLVKMRAGYGQLKRRKGIKYAVAEYNFQKNIYKIGFLSFNEFLINLITRIPLRLLPDYFLEKIYKMIRNS